ncbi:hypothetical protein BDD12DRAFT_806544 [Trichophaea hybrida]|nr:hypothetical protein BDD12DRAFT_806544 [Trichophaea hybrida]
MAEFGLAVNILTVVDIAIKLTTLSSQYASSAKDHGTTVHTLIREISTLTGVLNAFSTSLSFSQQGTNLLDGPLEECKQQLLELHEFLLKQVRGRNRWVRMGRSLKWPMRERETMVWVERIERFKRTFSLALQADGMSVTGKIRAELAEVKKAQEQERIDMLAERQRTKYHEVLAWLSPVHALDTHIETKKSRRVGTGRWFLEDQAFKNWGSNDKSFLRIEGSEGTGKTVLMSIVIDHLLQQGKQPTYFYCNATTKPTHLYGSILSQLLSLAPSLPPEIESYYNSSYHRRPYEHELQSHLLRVIPSSPNPPIILIDGLDEVLGKEELLATLLDIQNHCSLILTSREDEDITDTFEALPKFEIQPTIIAPELEEFIKQEVARISTLKRLKPELKTEVVDVIICESNGRWGWAKCALDQAGRMRTDKGVRQVLERLKRSNEEDQSVSEDGEEMDRADSEC